MMPTPAPTRRHVPRSRPTGSGRLLVAALAAAVFVAGACSGADDVDGAGELDGETGGAEQTSDQTAGSGDDPVSVETILREAPADVVVLASALTPLSMDPHASDSGFDPTFHSMIYDRLLEIANNLEVVPMLATEWGYVDGGTAFELTLRDGVVFHDGTPFDADAVVANIDRAKSIEGGFAGLSLSLVESAVAVDATHVRLELAPGARNIAPLLAGPAGFMVSPKALADGADLESAGTSAGSGPYRLESWVPNEQAVFSPVEGYWNPELQRRSQVYLVNQPSERARLDGFRSGAYDVVSVQGDLVDEALAAADAEDYRHLSQRQSSVYGMFLNPASPGLQSAEIRQAILYAINRNDIVDGLFGGTCESTAQTFSLGSRFYFPELEQRFYHDPEEARRLVAASGVENPSFDVLVPTGIYSVLAERIRPHLAEVGITMNIIESDLVNAGLAWQAGEAESAYLAMPAFADPGILISAIYLSQSTWQGPVIETTGPQLAALGALAPDDEQQTASYREILAGINDLALFVPGCSITTVWLWAPGVYGVDLMPNLWSGAILPYTVNRGEG